MLALLLDILAFPLYVIELAAAAAQFSPTAFLDAATSREAQIAALTIAFFAGVSEMLGQSVILVVNRVALYRFLASLAFTGFSYVVTAFMWAASAILTAPLTRVGVLTPDEFWRVAGVVSIAFAPRLLGVFSIAPYFGVALGNILEVWAMALAIFGLHVGLELPLGAAAFCGGAGWLVSYWLRSFLGRRLAHPLGRLRILISGSALEQTPQQIIDDMIAAVHGERKT